MGGGGTYLNIGLGSEGLSISLTGTASVGGMSGGGGTASFEVALVDAPSVFSLEGGSMSSGLGGAFGVGATGEVVTDLSGKPVGLSGGLEFGTRGGVEGGLEAHSKINTTSTIVGWSSKTGFVWPGR